MSVLFKLMGREGAVNEGIEIKSLKRMAIRRVIA
jgi:hypothetical protein